MMSSWIARFLALSVALFAHVAASADPPSLEALKSNVRYVSWQGIEPDKWASIWLIKRYISSKSFFQLIPPNTFPEMSQPAIAIDMPGGDFNRTTQSTLFEQLKRKLPHQHPELQYLEQIVHDIEVNIWEKPKHPHSPWFEAMYRSLQERYDKDQVPTECYLLFFDRLASLAVRDDITSVRYQNELSLSDECPGLNRHADTRIPEMNHRDILHQISLGKNVIFIDTREDEEFQEVRLPNSQLLRLRDVNQKTAHALADADLIVPYCVKDFRGFEVAKAIKSYGINQVATLSPNGLKGWLEADLPVVKPGGLSESEAKDSLFLCAMEPSGCLHGGTL